MTFQDILTVKSRLQTAFMPTSPLMAPLPALSNDPLVQDLYERVATLHFAALVTVCGPAPDRVSARGVRILDGKGGPPRFAYMATLGRAPDHASVDWFHAFEAGLTHFQQAGFPDCVTETVEDPNDPDSFSRWTIAETSDVVLRACRRLAAEDRDDALRHLARFAPQLVPARFNPDSPGYIGAHRRS